MSNVAVVEVMVRALFLHHSTLTSSSFASLFNIHHCFSSSSQSFPFPTNALHHPLTLSFMLDVVIIGAGAAGLVAARELAKGGPHRGRAGGPRPDGGRIHTLHGGGFTAPTEAGAEFVHGDLPVTLGLLREAGLPFTEMAGQSWHVRGDQAGPDDELPEDWPLLLHKLGELQEDFSIAAFLETALSEPRHAGLRESVRKFAEGYDAADTRKASALALREEWSNEEDSPQYRLPGGYAGLTDFLAADAAARGAQLHLSAPVREIAWAPGRAEVVAEDGRRFAARQVLVTVPLGVWQAGALRFVPDLPAKSDAARRMGFGPVIKLVLAFREAFWEGSDAARPGWRTFPGLGFLFSNAPVPTWWTRLPDPAPVLTGWLAGPAAAGCVAVPDDALLDIAFNSLAALVLAEPGALRALLVAHHVANWPADPYARGAYSYTTVGGGSGPGNPDGAGRRYVVLCGGSPLPGPGRGYGGSSPGNGNPGGGGDAGRRGGGKRERGRMIRVWNGGAVPALSL
jgi:monoamine oxidase